MEPGETIGRFTIIAMLDGDAGLARDPTLGREVVVRRFDPPPDAAALRREVLPATSALDGIASLHEVVRDGDAWVAVFEPVAGEPLTRWACAPGRSAREVAAVFRALAVRLAALHAAGDAHGALTAASVAIDGARVTIVDHGLAALAGARPTSAQDARAFAALWQRTLAQAGLHAPRALRRALASEPPRSIASWCAPAPRRWP
ncbi:MAG: hypothetical protein K8W52_46300, partial [Deltaproteobacteria bacterium]|nr:hypothetical protein [Deltaproteobacteria bacterium]